MPKPHPAESFSHAGALTMLNANSSRRQFLLTTGATSIIASGLPSCNKIWDHVKKPGDKDNPIDLGDGDIGILNYCYLLQQLEAAFYTQVLLTPFEGIRPETTSRFINLQSHEIAHREFYKTLLGTMGIPTLKISFKTIDFSKQDVVFQTARTFEDLVVKAYNGIADKIIELRFLSDNAKVLSVEARHAASAANLEQQFGSFADEVTIQGTEAYWTPSQVMAVAQLYILDKIDFEGISF